MKLTKREAIRECKRLWKEIGKSGLSKLGFLDSDEGNKWLEKGYYAACPLCQYGIQAKRNICRHCPFVTQLGKRCLDLGYDGRNKPTKKWLHAIKLLKD